MLRALRGLLWFCVGGLLGSLLVVNSAHASFPAYTITDGNVYSAGPKIYFADSENCGESGPPPAGGTSTLGAAQSAAEGPALGYVSSGYTFFSWGAVVWGSTMPTDWTSHSSCASWDGGRQRYFTAKNTSGSVRYRRVMVRADCAVGATWNNTTMLCEKVNSCPADATLSGGMCTCNAGYSEQSGPNGITCIGACPAYGTEFSAGYYDMGTSPTAGVPGYACTASGCAVVFSGTSPSATSLIGGVAHYYAEGSYNYVGPEETCTAGQGGVQSAPGVTGSTVPTSSCGANQFYAVVNGIGKCFDEAGQAQSGEPVKTETTTNELTTNPDGSTTVTTTTINNYTGGSSVTTTTYPSGTTPPVVPGSETKPIEETDRESECKLHPDLLQCKELGDVPADDTLATSAVGVSSITPVSVGGVGSCPADVALPHGAVMSYGPICTFVEGLKPVILALAWLSAALIVLGVKSDA